MLDTFLKQFVEFDDAIELIVLGFNEPCLGYFEIETKELKITKHPFNLENKNSEWSQPHETNAPKISAPLLNQVIEWLEKEKGIFLTVHQEFYGEGYNHCWQLKWYQPKDNWEWVNYQPNPDYPGIENTQYANMKSLYNGTYCYGDNNEYPDWNSVLNGAVKIAIKVIKEEGDTIYNPNKK